MGSCGSGRSRCPSTAPTSGPLLAHILPSRSAASLFCDAEFVPRLVGLELPALQRLIVRGEAERAARDRRTSPLRGCARGCAGRRGCPRLDGDAISLHPLHVGHDRPVQGRGAAHSANLHLANSANIALMDVHAPTTSSTPPSRCSTSTPSTPRSSRRSGPARGSSSTSASAPRPSGSGCGPSGSPRSTTWADDLDDLRQQPARDDDRDHGSSHVLRRRLPAAVVGAVQNGFGVAAARALRDDRDRDRDPEHATAPGRLDRPARAVLRGSPRRRARPSRSASGEVGRDPGASEPAGDRCRSNTGSAPTPPPRRFRNLWFHTGDRAGRDADGFFYYVDRLKDSIRRRGENISSFELESVISELDDVLECRRLRGAVGPRRGRRDGRRRRGTRSLTRSRGAVAHCERRMASFAVPRYVRLVDELPKTPSQRVQKFALREAGVTADTFDRTAAPTAGV